MTLAPFPVDDQTLSLIELSLDTTQTGQTSLDDLLDLLSGYDPDKLVPLGPDVYGYPEPLYSPHDVILALIDEVRRLRG